MPQLFSAGDCQPESYSRPFFFISAANSTVGMTCKTVTLVQTKDPWGWKCKVRAVAVVYFQRYPPVASREKGGARWAHLTDDRLPCVANRETDDWISAQSLECVGNLAHLVVRCWSIWLAVRLCDSLHVHPWKYLDGTASSLGVCWHGQGLLQASPCVCTLQHTWLGLVSQPAVTIHCLRPVHYVRISVQTCAYNFGSKLAKISFYWQQRAPLFAVPSLLWYPMRVTDVRAQWNM